MSYVKLTEAPTLIFNEPSCGTCSEDVESDGDGWVCPSCGTSWSYDDYDQQGTLYEEWSGETLDGDSVPEGADYFDDPQLRAKAAELRSEENLRFWGCEHGVLCSQDECRAKRESRRVR